MNSRIIVLTVLVLAVTYFTTAQEKKDKKDCNCSSMTCANKTTVENICKAGNGTVGKGECGCCDICITTGAALDSPCGRIMDGSVVVAKRKCREGLKCDRKTNTCSVNTESTTAKSTATTTRAA